VSVSGAGLAHIAPLSVLRPRFVRRGDVRFGSGAGSFVRGMWWAHAGEGGSLTRVSRLD
jgi:hypothetical protein